MTEIRFSLVGPGRVGRSLARWLTAAGARLEQIGARDRRAAEALAGECGGRAVGIGQIASRGGDLLILAVADSALPTIAARLAGRPQAPVAVHVAGGCAAEILAPLRQAGSRIATLHPLRAFPTASREPTDAHGLVFTLDGDPPAVDLAARMVRALGGTPIEIDASARPLYHLAASLAAGGVVTLLAVADEIAGELGLPRKISAAYVDLARQALDGVDAAGDAGPGRALTGPIARGDAEVVRLQLAELDRLAPGLGDVVRALGRETLRRRRASRGALEGDTKLARELGADPADLG